MQLNVCSGLLVYPQNLVPVFICVLGLQINSVCMVSITDSSCWFTVHIILITCKLMHLPDCWLPQNLVPVFICVLGLPISHILPTTSSHQVRSKEEITKAPNMDCNRSRNYSISYVATGSNQYKCNLNEHLSIYGQLEMRKWGSF